MQIRWIGTIAAATCLVVTLASGAIADPVQVSGFYSTQPFGAISSSELTLTFPDFAVNIFDNDFPSALALIPGFDVGNHSPVPFTQSTGTFSKHSVASPGSGIAEADVTGHLSFVGPTDTVNVPSECPLINCGQTLVEPITWSGSVRIQQGSHLLFSGSLHGTGTATALYGTFPPSQFWQGSDYTFTGLAQTPEPASIVLLASGAAWIAGRRGRDAGTFSHPMTAGNGGSIGSLAEFESANHAAAGPERNAPRRLSRS